jgi:hypothetical protein
LKIFLRPFISRWMARVDFVHLCIRYNPIRYSTKHCTLRLAPRSTRWPGREAIRATWLVHTPVADQRGRLWLPRARTSNQSKAISSRRAAPRQSLPRLRKCHARSFPSSPPAPALRPVAALCRGGLLLVAGAFACAPVRARGKGQRRQGPPGPR